MISIRELRKSFGKLEVLRSLEVDVLRGRIVGLAGPNACGKSTLVKSILGLVVPDSGTILVGGAPVELVSTREQIGYMPQLAEFPGNLSPNEIFHLIASLRKQAPVRRDELIDRFGVSEFLKKPSRTLSAGTRQKISAVAALMCQPEVLILDEPTAGFDPIACACFKDLLLEERERGTTIILVSHIMSELEQLVEDIMFMLDGQVIFSGPAAELRNKSPKGSLESGIVELMNGRTQETDTAQAERGKP